MKKIILCFIVLFISCFRSQAQTETVENQISGIRENVDYRQIQNVYLRISKTPQNVEGYIVFLDEDGQLCSTQGSIALSVKRKQVIAKSDARPKPLEIATEEIVYSQELVFKPEDFEFLTAATGGVVYALLVNLPPEKVAVGDKVVLEWNTFRIEQEVVEF